MNSNIEVPKPRAIDSSKVVYGGNPDLGITAPQPAKIDRTKIVYVGKTATVNIPEPAKVDRSKLVYLSDESTGIDIPMPATIDRAKLVYAGASLTSEIPLPASIDRSKLVYVDFSASGIPLPASIDRSKLRYSIVVPKPAVIDRDHVMYRSPAGEIPKPRVINREKLVHLEPKLSVLELNVHSPVTPGASNFPCFAVTPELEAETDRRIAQYPAEQIRSAVLPLLHEVQHKFGFISPESINWVAGKLGIEPIKVVEVVTFYPGFRQKAPGKLHVRVCRTLSCAMGGSYELMDKLCQLTGIDRSGADGHKDPISVSPCGNFSVEYAECLASCGTAPVCLVNDDFHEGITADKAASLLDSYQNA